MAALRLKPPIVMMHSTKIGSRTFPISAPQKVHLNTLEDGKTKNKKITQSSPTRFNMTSLNNGDAMETQTEWQNIIYKTINTQFAHLADIFLAPCVILNMSCYTEDLSLFVQLQSFAPTSGIKLCSSLTRALSCENNQAGKDNFGLYQWNITPF